MKRLLLLLFFVPLCFAEPPRYIYPIENVPRFKTLIVLDADFTNWNTAYGWGNHADANYLNADGSVDLFEDWVIASNSITLTAGTLTANTFTDTVATLTGGNFTGVGNITGADIDISAGTGDYSSSGTITSGNITILSATPILVFRDSDSLGAASVGYIEWRDSGGGRAGFLGNNSSGNDDLFWKNEQGGNIGIQTTGAGKFQIFANVELNNNSITGMGNITGSDVNISAGTGAYTSSGTLGAGAITGTSFTDSTATLTGGAFMDLTQVQIGTTGIGLRVLGTAGFGQTLIQMAATHTLATSTTQADDYDTLLLQRTSISNNAGATLNSTGSVATIINVVTETLGTVNDTTHGLEVVMDADGTGDGINITTGGGNAINTDGTIIAEQLTSTDDITMQGHLMTLGDDSATDIRIDFKASAFDSAIIFDESANKFIFGNTAAGESFLKATTMDLQSLRNTNVLESQVVFAANGYVFYAKSLTGAGGTIKALEVSAAIFATQDTVSINPLNDDVDFQVYSDNNLLLKTESSTDTFKVNGIFQSGDGGTTNYTAISATGDLTFVGTAGLVFGEIYGADASATITITTTGKANKVQITAFTVDGASNNTTPDHTNDHIAITTAGIYLCNVSLHALSVGGGGADNYGYSVYKNNGATEFANLHGQRDLAGGGGDEGSMSLSGIIDLAAPISNTDTTYAFVDSNPDTLTDSVNQFVADGFIAGQTLTISGSTSNDGDYTIATVAAGTITLIATDTLTAEIAGDTVTLTGTETIEVWIWNNTNDDDVVIDDINLSLVQIGGT